MKVLNPEIWLYLYVYEYNVKVWMFKPLLFKSAATLILIFVDVFLYNPNVWLILCFRKAEAVLLASVPFLSPMMHVETATTTILVCNNPVWEAFQVESNTDKNTCKPSALICFMMKLQMFFFLSSSQPCEPSYFHSRQYLVNLTGIWLISGNFSY